MSLIQPRSGRDRGSLAFVGLVGIGLVVAVVVTVPSGIVRPEVAVAFLAVVTAGEVMRVRLPGDHSVAPIGTAAALGYALLYNIGGHPYRQYIAQVVVVVAVGFLLASAIHSFAGRRVRLADGARRLVMVTIVAAIFHAVEPDTLRDLPLAAYRDDLSWIALLMVAIVTLAGIVQAMLGAAMRAGQTHAPFGAMLRDEVRATAGMGAATGATGVLIALATPTMNLYALPVFCVPLMLTQFAFLRYSGIRTTYLQTIRSLSRVTEVAGYVADGHARRVSHLAVEVGRMMGLSEQRVLDLEYAALLHDIGQLSLGEPIPNGSTLVVASRERRRLAEESARVIRSTGVLDAVADIVERASDPYRRRHEDADPSLLIESRIIKVVSAYDDLVGSRGGVDDANDALERLRLGMAYEYDPTVVATLTKVIERYIERTAQIPA